MKFTIEKSVLEDAINTVIRAVPSKSTIPAMEGILLEADGDTLTVTAYDCKTAIRTRHEANVKDNGRVVINARLFSDIIRKMPEDAVTIDCGADYATKLSCGKTHYNVSALPADDYPELPDVGESDGFEIKQSLLKSMLGGTTFAVSTNEARPVHTGALFDLNGGKLNIVACDGFRMAIRTEDVSGADMEFVVPGAALNEVERLCDGDDMVKISVGARHVQFFIGSTELISRRLEGDFLNYREVLPKGNNINVKVNAKSMMQSLDRVSVVVNEKLKSPVRCVIGDGKITMSAKTATGAAQDICKAEGNGGDMEIGFNGRYLLEAMKYAQEPVVNMSFQNSVTASIITGISGDGKFTMMVLPVRLKAN